MAAFVISEIETLDEELAQRYRTLASASIAEYGGRYLVRGGAVEVVEGETTSRGRVVVVEFPSMERAREWYASPSYAQALKLSETALDRRLIIVEGVVPPT